MKKFFRVYFKNTSTISSTGFVFVVADDAAHAYRIWHEHNRDKSNITFHSVIYEGEGYTEC